MHGDHRNALWKRKRRTTCSQSQFAMWIYKIYPHERQDHLWRRKATHRVSGRPDATLWTTEFQAHQFQQFKSRMNKGNIKLLSWSRCLNHTNIKTNFLKTWVKQRRSTGSAKHRKKCLKTWTTQRSSNFVRIPRSFSAQTVTPSHTAALFYCSAGRNLKHGRSVTHFQKDNHDLISIDGYVIKKSSSRRQSMVNLNDKWDSTKRQKCWEKQRNMDTNTSLTMERRGNMSVVIDDRRVSRGRHLEFRPTCLWKKHDYIATRSERLRYSQQWACRHIVMENKYLDICAQNVPQHNENVGNHETNIWRTPSSPTRQSIQGNNNVKIRISSSKEVKNTITLSTEEQDGNGIRSSWETSRILRLRRPHHGRLPLGKIGVPHGGIAQSLMKGGERNFFGMKFRIAGTQYRQFDGRV